MDDLRSRRSRRMLIACGLLCLLASLNGCSRIFYREAADRVAWNILNEKVNDPRWDVPRFGVVPDPRSRYFDPFHPDCEPLPPDDPAAHRYMHCAHGMLGSKCWHTFGQTFTVENPQWLQQFELIRTEPDGETQAVPGSATAQYGIRNLTLQDALELATIHNRDYQLQIENLYLEALELSFERFRFDVRFLGIGGSPQQTDLAFESAPGESDTLALSNRIGISRLLPTGGQLAVELANQTLWMFTGGNQTSSASVLSYSLVQPLLLGAGRKIAMENLTQAERDVLYAARDLARFRQQFFTDVVSGGGVGGYLGLLQQSQTIDNQISNIARLEEQVELLRALASQKPAQVSEPLLEFPAGVEIPPDLEGQLIYDAVQQRLVWRGPLTEQDAERLRQLSDDPAYLAAANEIISRLQSETVTLDVAQLETTLASSRNRLRDLQRQFQDSLDRFKIFLGLPPDLAVTIDESLLAPFQLIDERLYTVEFGARDFVDVWADLNPEDPDPVALQRIVSLLEELQQQIRTDALELVREDFERAAAARERKSETDRSGAGEGVAGEDQPPLAAGELDPDLGRERRLYESIVADFEETDLIIRKMAALVQEPDLPQNVRVEIFRQIAESREALLKISQSLQVLQVGLRVELIELNEFNVPMEEAVQIALNERVDLMNARAFVMDARRQVEIAANDLEAVLNIRAEGDLRTRGDSDNPLDFRGSESSFRAGVQFNAPLDRVNQRNVYRAALINYQAARRDYMAFEDEVKFSVRQAWRQLEVQRQNFVTAGQALKFAASQFDQAVEEATAPVRVGATRQSGNQGLNLLNALSSVLNAQNDLIRIWVDYERARLNIYRDMGIMEIDSRGVWLDPFYQQGAASNGASGNTSEDALTPPDLPPPPEPAHEDANAALNSRPDAAHHLVDSSGRLVRIRRADAPPSGTDVRPVGLRSGSGSAPHLRPGSGFPHRPPHAPRAAEEFLLPVRTLRD